MGKNSKRRRAERRATAGDDAPREPTRAAPRESWLHAKSPALRFIVVCGVLMGLFYGVFYSPPEESPRLNAFIRTYLGGYAHGAGAVLSLFGLDAHASGTMVFLEGSRVEVVRGCDAMEPIALFIAAIIAVQMSLRSKLIGIFAGVPILCLVNLVRIAALTYISVRFPEHFETAHLTVAQTVFILCTVSLWVAWAMWAAAKDSKSADVAPTG